MRIVRNGRGPFGAGPPSLHTRALRRAMLAMCALPGRLCESRKGGAIASHGLGSAIAAWSAGRWQGASRQRRLTRRAQNVFLDGHPNPVAVAVFVRPLASELGQ